MKASRKSSKGKLFETNVPKIPVVLPQKSMEDDRLNKNPQFVLFPGKSDEKKLCKYSSKSKSTAELLMKNISPFSISFDDIEDENDNVFISSSNGHLEPNSNSNIVTSTTKSDRSAKESSGNIIHLNSISETLNVRRRANIYRKRRKSSIYTEDSPIELPSMYENSSFNDNLHSESDEEYIKRIIRVQSIVRRFVVYRRIANEESRRLIDRNKLESDSIAIYNSEYSRIDNLVKSGKSCKEFDEAVDILHQYAQDITNTGVLNKEEEEKLKYLFYICSEDDTCTLFLHEFLVLTNDILKLSTPYFSYVMMFPEVNNKIKYTSFLQWYKTSKNKGVKKSSLV